jgi:transposase
MTPPCSEAFENALWCGLTQGRQFVRSRSYVTRWKTLRRETGGVSPGKIGGHKKPVLSGANIDWLRKRVLSRPFTLRKQT